MKTKKNGTRDQISRQAAIDALENEVRLIDGYYIMDDEVINKDDAIEAIRLLPSAQPEIILCKDCTWCQTVHGKVFCSREGAMDWIEPDSYCSYGEADGEIFDVEYGPESKGDWIPCSERLPDKSGEYLVTDDGWPITTVDVSEFFCKNGVSEWVSYDHVVAWMPVPEPYRGEQDD